MRDALLDLVLGSACLGCGRPGRALCRACDGDLPRHGRLAWPTPCPPGLAPPMAAGEYTGLLRLLVNAHKERRHFALAAPLGATLAHVVVDLRRETGLAAAASAPLLLVPVPSRRAVVRARGHDPMLRVSRRAAALLRRWGVAVSVAPVLAHAARVADQAGLDAGGRAANLAGALRCLPGPAHALVARIAPAGVVVVDDVLTTGSTAREAQRALEGAGLPVAGIATVAATRRRHPACPPDVRLDSLSQDSGRSLPNLRIGH